ncbi:MAG: 1-acyl-sn-glycerol-3-phosphate acyltransferase [Coprobacillus sp.]|nr:1-acyl-sn-glycerol-3-phosphate acyltransferase [Coprobacillus sp.]
MLHYARAVCRIAGPVIRAETGWLSRGVKDTTSGSEAERYKKVYKLINRVSRALHVQFHVEGWENHIDDTVALYTPNHASFFDPLAMLSIDTTPMTFVAKKEIADFLIVGKCVKYLNGLFMDREDIKGSLKVMNEVEQRLIDHDQSWYIYPEGERCKDTLLLLKEFHHGTFRNAMRAHAPIVPVATYGTFRVLKLHPQYKKYPVFIKYLKPLYYEDYKDMTSQEVAKYCQDEVQRCISFELRKKDNEIMSKLDKKYRFNQII